MSQADTPDGRNDAPKVDSPPPSVGDGLFGRFWNAVRVCLMLWYGSGRLLRWLTDNENRTTRTNATAEKVRAEARKIDAAAKLTQQQVTAAESLNRLLAETTGRLRRSAKRRGADLAEVRELVDLVRTLTATTERPDRPDRPP